MYLLRKWLPFFISQATLIDSSKHTKEKIHRNITSLLHLTLITAPTEYCWFFPDCQGSKAYSLLIHTYDVLSNKDLPGVRVGWTVRYPRAPNSSGVATTKSNGWAKLTTLLPCKYVVAWIRATKAGYYPFDYYYSRNIEVTGGLNISAPMGPFLKVGGET